MDVQVAASAEGPTCGRKAPAAKAKLDHNYTDSAVRVAAAAASCPELGIFLEVRHAGSVIYMAACKQCETAPAAIPAISTKAVYCTLTAAVLLCCA